MAGVRNTTRRVLIVDDRADVRAIVAMHLQAGQAFDVVGEAANGAEAIARVGELRPQLMVLDLQMPVMSGEEVIPILRSVSPQLRIVVFSAYAGLEQRLQPSERPDAEVRKGTELTPLVTALHRLHQQPPDDLVHVDLGVLDIPGALRASHEWARLNPAVREVAVEHGTRSEFLALVGVFLALGEPLQVAARSRWTSSNVSFATRLEAGRAARRALASIGESDAEPLEPLRTRLLATLPADQTAADAAETREKSCR